MVREEGLVPRARYASVGLRPTRGLLSRRGRFPPHPPFEGSRLLLSQIAQLSARHLSLVTCHPEWCERRDSNPQGFPHGILSPARLPVPPLSRGMLMVDVAA